MLHNIAVAALLAGPVLAGVILRQNTVTVVDHTVTDYVVSTIFSYEPATSVSFTYAPTTSDVSAQTSSSSVPPPPRNGSSLNSTLSAGVNPINGMPLAPISSVPAKAAVNSTTPTKPAVTVITPYKLTTIDGTLTPVVGGGALSTFSLTYSPEIPTSSTPAPYGISAPSLASPSSLSFQFFTPSTSAPKTSAAPQNSSSTSAPITYSPIPTTYCLSCSTSLVPLSSNSHMSQAPPGQSAILSSSGQSALPTNSAPSTHEPVPTPKSSPSSTPLPSNTAPGSSASSSQSSSPSATPPSTTASPKPSTTSATPTTTISSITDTYPYPIPAAPAPSSSGSTSSEFAYPYPTKRSVSVNMSLLLAAGSLQSAHNKATPTPTNALQVLQSALASYSAHHGPAPQVASAAISALVSSYQAQPTHPPPIPKPTGAKTLTTPIPSPTPTKCSYGATWLSPTPNARPTNIDYSNGGAGCIPARQVCYESDQDTDQYGHCVDKVQGLTPGK